MQKSVTTSIRLSPHLRKALELRAKREGRGKNWVISRALESYLESEGDDHLAAEARRQSLRASGKDFESWESDADFADWKGGSELLP